MANMFEDHNLDFSCDGRNKTNSNTNSHVESLETPESTSEVLAIPTPIPRNDEIISVLTKRKAGSSGEEPTIMQLITRSKAGGGAKIQDNKEKVTRKRMKKSESKDDLQREDSIVSNPEQKTGKLVLKEGKIVLKEEEEAAKSSVSKDNGRNLEEKVSSMSFTKRNFSEKWIEEETSKFFKALEIFGSDFSMIAPLFPSRNRNQIKNKFRREERENAKRVDAALAKHRGKKFFSKQILDKFSTQPDGDFPENLGIVTRTKRLDSATSIDSMDLRIADDLSKLLHSAVSNSMTAKGEIQKFQSNSGEKLQKKH